MVPFDPLVGEFRVHYAGFFDPGFGYAGAGGKGRARGARSALARGAVHPRARPDRRPAWSTRKCCRGPDAMYGQRIGSNYQAQGLKLSKHFRV
jgi:dCTP deaminase